MRCWRYEGLGVCASHRARRRWRAGSTQTARRSPFPRLTTLCRGLRTRPSKFTPWGESGGHTFVLRRPWFRTAQKSIEAKSCYSHLTPSRRSRAEHHPFSGREQFLAATAPNMKSVVSTIVARPSRELGCPYMMVWSDATNRIPTSSTGSAYQCNYLRPLTSSRRGGFLVVFRETGPLSVRKSQTAEAVPGDALPRTDLNRERRARAPGEYSQIGPEQ